MGILDSLSARHQELIGGIVKNLGNVDIDWEAVAKDANFSSAKYAKDEYRKVRKTLDSVDGNGGGAKKKASPKKRKNDDSETPKSKGSKKAKKTASSSEEDGDKDDEEVVKAEVDSDEGDLV